MADRTLRERLRRATRKLQRAILRDEPRYYDMFENAGERYAARLYLSFIREALEHAGLRPPLDLLDAGCQAGRLAIPLAQDGHRVTGVDTSDLALRRARRHASENGVGLELIRADLSRWLPRSRPERYDAVVCTEVLYLRSNYRMLLAGLLRVLKTGGLGFVSHRPTAYYLAEALRRGDVRAAERVSAQHEGELFGSYYNWQDPDELTSLYRSLGAEILSIRAIGAASWRAAPPDTLDEESRERLWEADLAAGVTGSEGRYLLVTARKP